tara:strand:+ start:123 stop:1253 length:1131 start_codon:yes stop_codon:yes gene_type:complete
MNIRRSSIIVDLTFGDYGKGVTVSNLCLEADAPLVVRYTGGQQAAHHVVFDGVSHTFSSFGSGTLQEVPTYFSKHTMMYLPNMMEEHKLLEERGLTPKLFLDPLTMVTTPYDVAWNRLTESKSRHGSCGIGISSTMERNLNTPYKLYAADLKHPKLFAKKLEGIKDYYIDREFALTNNAGPLYNLYLPEERRFKEALSYKSMFDIATLHQAIDQYAPNDLIFEGAQGIMLDEDHGIHPNTTWGHTTSRNAWECLEQIGYDSPVDMYHGTRCYGTRHGAGWMGEESDIELDNPHTEMNGHNEWQGDFRRGELDVDTLKYAINCNRGYYRSNDVNEGLVVTCLDQRPGFDMEALVKQIDIENVLVNDSPITGHLRWYD